MTQWANDGLFSPDEQVWWAGEPRDGDLVIRQSMVSSMKLCPARVGLANAPGFLDEPSEAMLFGTLVHALIADTLLGKQVGWSEVVAHTERLAAEEGGALPSTEAKAMAEEAAGALHEWHAQLWDPTIQPTLVEQTIVRPLGLLTQHSESYGAARRVWLQGTIDAYAAESPIQGRRGGTVFDWKTAGRGWKVNKNGESKGHFSPQAPTYLHLLEGAGHQAEWMDFCVYDRSKAEWEIHSTHWSPHQVEAALIDIWQYAKMIHAQTFPFTPGTDTFGKAERGWWCSPRYCGAWNICPGKAMIADSANLDEIAGMGD